MCETRKLAARQDLAIRFRKQPWCPEDQRQGSFVPTCVQVLCQALTLPDSAAQPEAKELMGKSGSRDAYLAVVQERNYGGLRAG